MSAAAAADSCGGKRSADAAGLASPPSAGKARRTAAMSFGHLSEDAMAGERAPAESDEVQALVLGRAWWAQWSTPFLFTWIWDFAARPKDLSFAKAEDREFILSRLVEGNFARPKEGEEEKQFLGVWRKYNGGATKAAKAANPPPPARHSAMVMSSAAAAMAQGTGPRDGEERKQNGRGPARIGQAPQAAAAAAAAHVPLPPEDLRQAVAPAPLVPPRQLGNQDREPLYDEDVGDEDEEEMECEKLVAEVPSFVRPPQHDRGSTPLPPPRGKPSASVGFSFPTAPKCMTCLVPNPDPREARWICACGLRGDMDAGDLCNIRLFEIMALKAGAKGPETLSSPSSSAGQSLAQGQAANRLERELKHLASGDPHPLFVGPKSTAPMLGKEALSIVRKALGASATETPSAELIKLVTKGLLVHPGYCVPRLLAQVRDKDSSLMLANGSEIPIQASGSGPPKIPSLHAFMSACVNVIFPLLMGQPAALAEWFALTASVLELASKKDWSQANEYLSQLLQERVTEQRGFAEPSQTVLTTLAFVGAASTTASSVSLHSNGGAQRPNSYVTSFCEAYNWGNGCSDPCPGGRRHECQYAHRGCTAGKSHRSKDCPHRPNRGGGSQGSANRGGRGGHRGGHSGGGGGGGSSGSSVATSKPATQA